MPRVSLSPSTDARLLAEREADRATGNIGRIAAKLGLTYKQVYDAFLRLDGRRKRMPLARPAAPGRVCRCGAPVFNDEATDFRFCAGCRGAAASGIARFAAEARP